jgi:hypothetical protein
MLPPL